jgi:hypothetical protein
MAMDGFFDSRPKSDLFAGDFYAGDDQVLRGATLDVYPTKSMSTGKGAVPLFDEFESLDLHSRNAASSAVGRYLQFPGTNIDQQLKEGSLTGRSYLSTAPANALLHAMIAFFSEECDAVLEFTPEKCTIKAHVNASHSLLKLKIGFSLSGGCVAMSWSRQIGDATAFVQTAKACSKYCAATTGVRVELSGAGLPSPILEGSCDGFGGLCSPGLGGLQPPGLGGLSTPSFQNLGGLAPPLGLAPPEFGFAQGTVLELPPCEPEDVEPILDLARDPACHEEGAQSLVKMLESTDAQVCAQVLLSHLDLVEALLAAPACVLAAPALVERLLDTVDVGPRSKARLAETCATRLASEETQLGQRQLARLLLHMLNRQIMSAEISSKVEVLRTREYQDAPTMQYLSEAVFALESQPQALAC